jgi:hypothetical protein
LTRVENISQRTSFDENELNEILEKIPKYLDKTEPKTFELTSEIESKV